MRKLASIQVVNAVEPIEGADKVERIRVLGWYLVAGKGDFRVGDLCVYCEIDSLMPERPEFMFLKERCQMVIRTAVLAKQVSQGIAFPLSVLDGHMPHNIVPMEGDDVTGYLGVVKYEPELPAELVGKAKGPFPGHISKTEEVRVQNAEPVLARHNGRMMHATEKIHGQSETVYLRDGEFGVCMHGVDLLETEGNPFWIAARLANLEDKFRHYRRLKGMELTVQAELAGPGVPHNYLGLKEPTLFVFNIFDNLKSRHLDFLELLTVAGELELTIAPVVERFVMQGHTVDEFVRMATRMSKVNPSVRAEGIVIRPDEETNDPMIGRLSIKAINPEFLLQKEKKRKPVQV
jgi:RNA ligase (TIGR02306 family)